MCNKFLDRFMRNMYPLFRQVWYRLTLRKTVQNTYDDLLENEHNRPLNFFHLNTLGLGAIIGAGIFVISGTAAGDFAGPSIILSFIIAGLVAFLVAFSYAEMSAMVPANGSSYTYIYTTMGEFSAWLIGWNLFLQQNCAMAVIAVAWSNYVSTFLKSFFATGIEERLLGAPINWNQTSESFYKTGDWFNLPAMVMIVFLTALLLYDVDASAKFNSIIVVGKILILLIFIFTAIKYVDPENYKDFIPKNEGGNKYGVAGLFHSTTLVFFAYIGFEAVCTAAEETKKSTLKLLPLSIITSLSISMVLYLAVSSVMVGVVHYTKLQGVKNPISLVSKMTGLKWLEIMVNCGAILGLTSVLLTNIFSSPRILYAMARDGLLPEIFAVTRMSRRSKKKAERAARNRQFATQPSAAAQMQASTLLGEILGWMKTKGPALIEDSNNITKMTTAIEIQGNEWPIEEKVWGTPCGAQIITSVISTVGAGFFPMEFLTETTSIGTLFTFFMVHFGVIVMHWTHRPSDSGRLYSFPSRTLILPLIGIGSCVLFMNATTKWTKIRFAVWMMIGQIVYWSYSRGRSHLWKKRKERQRVTAMKNTTDRTNDLHNIVVVEVRRLSVELFTITKRETLRTGVRSTFFSEGTTTNDRRDTERNEEQQ